MAIRLGDRILDESAKTPGENLDREKERAGGDVYPAAAIERKAAAGNDTMNVGVKDQSLTPGVKHGEHADVCAKLRGRDINQSLAGGAKQNGIEDLGRVQGQGVQNVEDLFAPLLEPALPGLDRTVRITRSRSDPSAARIARVSPAARTTG